MLIGGHFIGGPCDQGVGKSVLRNPFDGSIAGTAAEGGPNEALAAVESATEAFESWRGSPPEERESLLRRIAASVRSREEELAGLLVAEIGKPLTWAKGEVSRLAITFDLAAALCRSMGPESHDPGYDPRGEHYACSYERFPVGPILCIVPYNWPYNLAAHKIAPALATGNTVVLKTSPLAPLCTLTLARLAHECGCPPGVLNAVNVDDRSAEKMVLDERIAMVSFTGSGRVGWHVKSLAPEKRVLLEMGGDASAIVCSDADLEFAAKRLALSAYGYAGQVCISAQHCLAQAEVYERMRAMLVDATAQCPTGDPRLEGTVCGPVIHEQAADRIVGWVDEARSAGARVLVGGAREGNVVQPTLVEGVPFASKLGSEEVFGPVLTLEAFDSLDAAIEGVNRSRFGIHSSVFTKDLAMAGRCFKELQVGGVVVNDYPTLRFDGLPYGGAKRSGFGREGVRFAMEEMTAPKALMVGKD